MKAPDAALVRARAKAPLHDLQALHLSTAELSCLRGLESCLLLRSLYANGNLIKEIDGLTSLRRLWRVDLSDNFVQQLQPLASFAALGFVNLERNQLTFQDFVCLRDVHIIELRVCGNRSLDSGTSPAEYRMKLVALLPYVWVVDGHFVTTLERAEALDAYDGFVQQLLTQSQSSAASLHFGSTSDLWGGSSLVLSDDFASPVQEEALKLLQTIERQPTRLPEQQDLYRLRAVASFHDNESDIHNAHAHFAPQRHSHTAKLMPTIRLAQALALSQRTRLELSVLLATHLSFPIPGKLLAEALMISILSDGGAITNTALWIEELTQLPPYGHVALVSAMRRQTLEEIDIMQRNHSQELPSSLEMLLWRSLPAVIPTLLSTEQRFKLIECDAPDQAFVQRCAFAVSLLVRATSFPDTTALGSPLAALIEAARLASTQLLESVGFMVPSVLLNSSDPSWKKPKPAKHAEREYRRPWNEKTQAADAAHRTLVASPSVRAGKRTRLPRPGEWLELKAKLFVRISSVSTDGAFVTATGANAGMTGDGSSVVTLRVDQIDRVSSSMWRLTDSDEQLLGAILSQLGQTPTKARLGKLHRDSEAFHRHGAARNQGFPNRSLSCQDLRQAVMIQDISVGTQPQPVELFSSADTLDANYVLTSPALVSLQNACAVRSLSESNQPLGGLWRPIESPSFQVMQDNNADAVDTPSKKTKSTRLKKPQASPVADDWLTLQRDMQALLGIQPDTRDADCFITSVPIEGDAQRTDNNAQVHANDATAIAESTRTSLQAAMTRKASLSVTKPKRLAALSWHHVATKPQLLVASNGLPVGYSPQKKTAITASTSALTTPLDEPVSVATSAQELPQSSASRPNTGGSSSSTRTPMRLTRCHVSLPSLSIQSQK